MTFSDVMALILRYFTEFGSFRDALVKVYVYNVVVKKFTFAISFPGELLVVFTARPGLQYRAINCTYLISWLESVKEVLCFHIVPFKRRHLTGSEHIAPGIYT